MLRVIRQHFLPSVTWGMLLLCLSLIANLALAHRVRVLERTILLIKEDGGIRIGNQVGPIETMNPDGTVVSLDYAKVGVPTLLYVLTPKCIWCQRNNSNLAALISQAGAQYRVVIVSLTLEGIDDYRHKYLIKDNISALSPQSQLSLRVGGTPTTLLISKTGALLGKWVGAYGSNEKQEIERLLEIKLPGLPPTRGGVTNSATRIIQ